MPQIPINEIQYSDKYFDETHEFRHVIIPRKYVNLISKTHLMSEAEWRSIGIQQSPGWVHYLLHGPEPHVICFRRPLEQKPAPLGNATNREQIKVWWIHTDIHTDSLTHRHQYTGLDECCNITSLDGWACYNVNSLDRLGSLKPLEAIGICVVWRHTIKCNPISWMILTILRVWKLQVIKQTNT